MLGFVTNFKFLYILEDLEGHARYLWSMKLAISRGQARDHHVRIANCFDLIGKEVKIAIGKWFKVDFDQKYGARDTENVSKVGNYRTVERSAKLRPGIAISHKGQDQCTCHFNKGKRPKKDVSCARTHFVDAVIHDDIIKQQI